MNNIFLFLIIFLYGLEFEERKPEPMAPVWIQQLGDDEFTVREKASRSLLKAGWNVHSELMVALHSDDPEVKKRAREILDQLHKLPEIAIWPSINCISTPTRDDFEKTSKEIQENGGELKWDEWYETAFQRPMYLRGLVVWWFRAKYATWPNTVFGELEYIITQNVCQELRNIGVTHKSITKLVESMSDRLDWSPRFPPNCPKIFMKYWGRK